MKVKHSDCEKCGRWIGGEVGSVYWCSRLGAVPKLERFTFCPFFYRSKVKVEPDSQNGVKGENKPGGRA